MSRSLEFSWEIFIQISRTHTKLCRYVPTGTLTESRVNPNGDEYLIFPHTISIPKVASCENKQNHQLWDITFKDY